MDDSLLLRALSWIAGAVIVLWLAKKAAANSRPRSAGDRAEHPTRPASAQNIRQTQPHREYSSAEIEALRQNLRLKVLYDETKIDHLIAMERERLPKGSLAELMQAAIERWERDNR